MLSWAMDHSDRDSHEQPERSTPVEQPQLPIESRMNVSALRNCCQALIRIVDNVAADSQSTGDRIGTGTTPGTAIFREHRAVFRNPLRARPYPSPATRPRSRPTPLQTRPSPRKPEWGHNFYCLADPNTLTVPTNQNYKHQLISAGLGEKRIQMPMFATSAQLHDILLQNFPQLGTCGGYELLKCIPNSRTLQVIDVPSGYTPETLKEEIGQGRIYLRPVQRSIPLTAAASRPAPCVVETGPRESCLSCGESFPMTALRSHVLHCRTLSGPGSSTVNREGPANVVASPSVSHPSSHSSASCSSSLPIPSSLPSLAGSSSHPGPSSQSCLPGPSSLPSLPSLPPLPSIIHLPSLSTNPGPSSNSSGSRRSDVIEISSDSSDNEGNGTTDPLDILHDIFPQFELHQLQVSLTLCDNDPKRVCQLLLDTLSTRKLIRLLKRKRMSAVPRSIVVHPDSILRDALHLYKSPEFNYAIPLQVEFEGQPAIDAGGVRRQFFTTMVREMALSSNLRLFEGDLETRSLLPVYSQQSVVQGYFRLFGRILVHSILQEGPAFPCLPESIYRYLVTEDIRDAIPYLTTQDLPPIASAVVQELLEASTPEKIQHVARSEDCMDLMINAGCYEIPTLTNRNELIQAIMTHEILLKRKAPIDHLAEGLGTLGFLQVVRAFPDVFRSLFVYTEGSTSPSAEALIDLLRLPKNSTHSDSTLENFEYLRTFILSLDREGRCNLLQFCTGSANIPPMGFQNPYIEVEFQPDLDAITASTCFHTVCVPMFTTEVALHTAFNSVITDSDFSVL